MGGTESLLVSATAAHTPSRNFQTSVQIFLGFPSLSIWLIQAHLAKKVSRLLKRDDEDDDHELLSVAPAWC